VTAVQTPDLTQTLLAFVRAGAADAWIALPGRIESFDADKQRATVKPLVKKARTDEGGNRIADSLPIITGVPVVFAGGGGFRETFPVAAGDTCELRWHSASLDRWLARGGEVDPEDDRRQHLSDAVAYVGLRDFAHPLTYVPTDRCSFGKDGSDGPAVEVTGSEVFVGGGTHGHEPTFLADSFFTGPGGFDALILAIATAAAGTGGGVTSAINSAYSTFKSAASLWKTDTVKVR